MTLSRLRGVAGGSGTFAPTGRSRTAELGCGQQLLRCARLTPPAAHHWVRRPSSLNEDIRPQRVTDGDQNTRAVRAAQQRRTRRNCTASARSSTTFSGGNLDVSPTRVAQYGGSPGGGGGLSGN